MTKKFWKFVNEDGCSPGRFGEIKYIPGETVEVEDADPDAEMQCSSGIHCLDFSDEKYDDHNITFGPKVAILEVDEEDIIYYEKGGKCRVKKAKVLEVKEPEIWMQTGNRDIEWLLHCVYHCGHHSDVMQVIIDEKNAYGAYHYALDILKGHDEGLMQAIIDSGNPYYSYSYALDILKGHDEGLMQVIINAQDAFYAYYYACRILKGHDERIMQAIIDAQDSRYAYYYALEVLKKHDERLMEAIKDNDYKRLYIKLFFNKEKQSD